MNEGPILLSREFNSSRTPLIGRIGIAERVTIYERIEIIGVIQACAYADSIRTWPV